MSVGSPRTDFAWDRDGIASFGSPRLAAITLQGASGHACAAGYVQLGLGDVAGAGDAVFVAELDFPGSHAA